MAQKQIVILGASYGGLSTAHYLLKHVIPKLPEKEYLVTVISSSNQVLCRPACPRAMISDDMLPQNNSLFVDVAGCLKQYGSDSVRFINGTAEQLDHVNRTVTIRTGENIDKIEFHALVIATGASTTSYLFGLNKDSDTLRASWAAFREALPIAKTIVIAGGGPTGVETAGELGEFLNGKPGWFGNNQMKVQIIVIASGSQILPLLRSSIAEKAEVFLSRVGVKVIKNTKVMSVEPHDAGVESLSTKATLTLSNGETLQADLYIPAIGTKPNTQFVSSTLLVPDGRIETNPTFRVEKAGPRIYALGDVASCARPAIHNILSSIPLLCVNIKRDLLLDLGQYYKCPGLPKSVTKFLNRERYNWQRYGVRRRHSRNAASTDREKQGCRSSNGLSGS